MKVISPLYHRAKAEVRRKARNEAIVVLALLGGFLIAMYFISEELASRGF